MSAGYGAAPTSAGVGTQISPYIDPAAAGAAGNEITTLWIGNVLPGTTDFAVAVQMVWYGSLQSCFLLKSISPQGQMSGFVRYSTYLEAQTALNAIQAGQVVVNGQPISGKLASKNSSDIKNPELAAAQQAMLSKAFAEAQGLASDGDPNAFFDQALAQKLTGGQVVHPAAAAAAGHGGCGGGIVGGGHGIVGGGMLGGGIVGGGIVGGGLQPTAGGIVGGGGPPLGGPLGGYNVVGVAPGMQQDWQLQQAYGMQMQQHQPLAIQGSGMNIVGIMPPAQAQLGQPQYIPPRFPEEEITTLWCGNMLPGTSDYMLAVQLSRFGEMSSCFLMKNLSPNGQMSGFARFNDRGCAQRALDAIQQGQVVVGGSALSGKFASRNSSELKDEGLKAKTREMLSMAMSEALGFAPSGGTMPAADAMTMATQMAPM